MSEGIKKISENVIINKRALLVTDYTVADNNAISLGALWTSYDSKGLKIKIGENVFSLLDAVETIMPATISTDLLKDGCVTSLKLANNSVTTEKLVTNSVTSLKLADNSVTESKIANDSVSSSKLKDNCVISSKLADNSVSNLKLENNAVTTEKIKDKTITASKLANSSVEERTIKSESINEKHYMNDSISNEKLKDGSVFGSKIANLAIESNHMGENSVLTFAIANAAVTGDKLADKAVNNRTLDVDSVDSINLQQGAVTKDKLAIDSVSTEKVEDKAITKSKLADDIVALIGDPVTYDNNNNVELRNDLKVLGSVNVVGDIRARKIYNSVFMDLAEGYEPETDSVCIPGDIVQVNENGKIVKASASSHCPIVGVVSDEYAACYGATPEELEAGTKIAIGLIGKVHVNVIGAVKLGDKIALAKDGAGASVVTNNVLEGNIIGKALESNTETGLKKVLCLIFPS